MNHFVDRIINTTEFVYFKVITILFQLVWSSTCSLERWAVHNIKLKIMNKVWRKVISEQQQFFVITTTYFIAEFKNLCVIQYCLTGVIYSLIQSRIGGHINTHCLFFNQGQELLKNKTIRGKYARTISSVYRTQQYYKMCE